MPVTNNAHALVVGIANYQHINPLTQVVLRDALDVYHLLIDPSLCSYPPSNVRLLLDTQATKVALRKELINLTKNCDQDSTVFLYMSCHGGRIESGPYIGEYLLPADTLYISDQSLVQTALSGSELTAALQAIPARKIVAVFDCCHAGGIGEPKDVVEFTFENRLPENYYNKLTVGRGRVILASSRSTEYSWIMPGATNSLFTQHLLAGLRGGTPGPGGVIRIFDLFHYLQPKVTSDQPNQHPICKAEVEENFPVALYLGGKHPLGALPTLEAGMFTYDVFISYRRQEPDKSWVCNILLPRLKAEGLRVCIDYQCFRLGVPLVVEMARAVEQSRYTLAILSPAYLSSNFTQLENVLAEHLGLEQSQRRMLSVLRELCNPRLGLRARLWLDMTDDDEFETDLARLVYELRQPAET